MASEMFEAILVAALVGLAVLVCALLFVFRLTGRGSNQSDYVERCRKCQAELTAPVEPCPRCGCESPSAERQGGDVDDDDGGE